MDKMKYTVAIGRINDYPISSYLNKQVNDLIDEGWKPLGGIAIHDGFIYQAMIKEENEKAN